MTTRNKRLIKEIEELAHNESKSLTIALRKCVTLGGSANCEELRDWANKELRGYSNLPVKDVPEYRVLNAPIFMDVANSAYRISGQRVSISIFPAELQEYIKEEIYMTQGIAEIANIIESSSESDFKIGMPNSPELVRMTYCERNVNGMIHDIYYRVHRSNFIGILDHVRTILVTLVAELDTLDWSEEAEVSNHLEQAVNVAVYGVARKVQVNLNVNQSKNSKGESHASNYKNVEHEPNITIKIGLWLGILASIATVITAGYLFIK